MATNITTPVGRLVGGSLYKAETTDYLGNPLTIKTGVNAGQPTSRYSFGLAIPKNPAIPDWKDEAWGKLYMQEAQASFRNSEFLRPDFSWKVQDGDSTIPNKMNKRNCDNPNYRGNWILWFSSSFAPQCYNSDGSQRLLEVDAIKLGYFVQVAGTIAGNNNTQNAGLFANGSMVALTAYGEEIRVGADATAVGFGEGVQLPAGASATPVGGFTAPATPDAPIAPAPAPAPAPQQAAPAPAPQQAAPAPAPQQAAPAPAPQQAAPAPAPQQAAPAPAPAPAPQPYAMTALANGLTREQYLASGWTDENLIAMGMMTVVQPHTGILQA